MGLQSLVLHLQNMFSGANKTDIEKFIISRNPKSPADVEHLLLQYTYQNNKDWLPNA